MNKTFTLLPCFGACIVGAIYFAYLNELFIIKIPVRLQLQTMTARTITKKKIRFFFWDKQGWHHEDQELMWQDENDENLQQLVSTWLTWSNEEQRTYKKVLLQSAVVTPAQEAYLSFDRNPFSKEQSTFEKWLWIESLLKTVSTADIPLQAIYFLVHHQPLHDVHLDFSTAWPVVGFFKT